MSSSNLPIENTLTKYNHTFSNLVRSRCRPPLPENADKHDWTKTQRLLTLQGHGRDVLMGGLTQRLKRNMLLLRQYGNGHSDVLLILLADKPWL